MDLLDEARERMVRTHVRGRGIRDERLLGALRDVPREAFLPPEQVEHAYADRPLPIGLGQTISQPYIVARMLDALGLQGHERVLEVGTGSGWAAALLGRLAREVHTIERHPELAQAARERLATLGAANVHVHDGDGTLGWAAAAPYDAIVVAAAGPEVPPALLDQLAPEGRLVIPVGPEPAGQELLRIVRDAQGAFARTSLGAVSFVPLIGAQGWPGAERAGPSAAERARLAPGRAAPAHGRHALARLVAECAEPFDDLERADLGALRERIGSARRVLVGEGSHGTSEFYAFRARLTRELIERAGVAIVAIEGDWPDVAAVDRWVRGAPPAAHAPHDEPFARFPRWMWRNHETLAFLAWLRDRNARLPPERRVAFRGLDLYAMYASIRAVIAYLERVDPPSARLARERYGCLTPWEPEPARYGRAALSGRHRVCEREAVAILTDLLARRLEYSQADGERFLDAVHNARLVADAERYYRAMYWGGDESWNLRDEHMFETLEALCASAGRDARAVVWAHNSHLGDARATEPGARGQLDVGQLVRERHGDRAYLIGQGTDTGTVAAAEDWDGPMEVQSVRPALTGSCERLCHEAGVPAFLLPLSAPRRAALVDELSTPRLQRAIGVVYRPQTERASHYYHVELARQFDEWVWFDRTQALSPLEDRAAARLAPDHPLRPRAAGEGAP